MVRLVSLVNGYVERHTSPCLTSGWPLTTGKPSEEVGPGVVMSCISSSFGVSPLHTPGGAIARPALLLAIT